jgi:hypothetical protein
MYTDPNGKSFIGILGTILLGATIGAVVGAVVAAINGDDMFAGFVSGAVSGAIITASVAISLASGPLGPPICDAGAFLGGYLGDYGNQGMNNGWNNIDRNHALIAGGITAIISLATFGIMSHALIASPEIFGNVTSQSLSFLSRLNASLSINVYAYYIAVTYGVIATILNTLLNSIFDSNGGESGEIVIDAVAG